MQLCDIIMTSSQYSNIKHHNQVELTIVLIYAKFSWICFINKIFMVGRGVGAGFIPIPPTRVTELKNAQAR